MKKSMRNMRKLWLWVAVVVLAMLVQGAMAATDGVEAKADPLVEGYDTGIAQKVSGDDFDPNDLESIKRAAKDGNADAQYCLGHCYAHGDGVEQDYKTAVKWYTKSAKQGNAEAQRQLGGCYYRGDGVKQDYVEAVLWYAKSADQGNAKAQYNLGYCYEHGYGVSQSRDRAISLYTLSAEQGYEKAETRLSKMLESTPTPAPIRPSPTVRPQAKYPRGLVNELERWHEDDFYAAYPGYRTYDDIQPAVGSSGGGNWTIAERLMTVGGGLYRVVNCNEWVSCRTEANTGADVLQRFYLGQLVNVIGSWREWYLCECDNSAFGNSLCGWVLAKYLANIEYDYWYPELPVYGSQGMYVVNCDSWVSLRSSPSKNSSRLAKVPLGAYVEAWYFDSQWYECVYQGMTGYILSAYLSTSYQSYVQSEYHVKVSGGSTNVRSGPGLGYEDIGTLHDGEEETYLNESAVDDRGVNWYKVSHAGRVGWVSSKYCTVYSGKPWKNTDTSTYYSGGSYVKVSGGNANLRSGPALTYDDIGTIHNGETAEYLNSEAADERGVTWYKVNFNGKVGWVSSKYATVY